MEAIGDIVYRDMFPLIDKKNELKRIFPMKEKRNYVISFKNL